MDSHQIKKLQIGSGRSSLRTWFCTDIEPRFGKSTYLDATKPFPFKDNTFDYIFSEHLIEHLTYQQGLSMLRECHRVLKSGGTMRCATPDLMVLVGLLDSEPDVLKDRYIQYITDTFLNVDVYKGIFVFNNAFRAWGHKFIYDRELLTATMRQAGFINITKHKYGESKDPNLTGLETHGKIVDDEEMASFETMILEGMSSK